VRLRRAPRRDAESGRGRAAGALGTLLVLLLSVALAAPGALATDSGPTPREMAPESEDDADTDTDAGSTPAPTPTPTPTPKPTRSPSGTSTGGSGTATASTPRLVGLTVDEARRVLVQAGRSTEGLARLPGGARIVGQEESEGGLMLVTIAEEEPANDDDPGVAPGVPTPSETEPLDPSTVPADAAQPVDDLVAECNRLDSQLDRAQLRLDDDLDLTIDEPVRLPVEVTLDIDAPSRRIVAVEDATVVDIRVTCRVNAQLRGAPEEFDIDERNWVTQSLLTERTAEWSWFVTPRRTGNTQLEVLLQPVIHVDSEDAVTGEIAASILRHPITVSVSAPADQSIGVWLDRLTGLLNSAQGLLLALTAVILAALGLWAALRHRSSPST
jgi:hypothetical protein